MFLLLGGAADPASATAEWLALMESDAVRLTFEGGLGALFAFVAWLIGMVPFAQRLPREGRKFFPAIWAGAGVPIAFVISRFVPGTVALELLGFLAAGGGASHFVHKGAEKAKLDDTARGLLGGHSHKKPKKGEPPYYD